MKKILLFSLVGLSNLFFCQNDKNLSETILNSKFLNNVKINVDNEIINPNIKINKNVGATITPLSQTISSGNAITNITSSPVISDALKLDCVTGGAGSFIPNANNGIFFDLANTGTVPVRINGFDVVLVAATATTATTAVPFSLYKTTTATTAVGNYTTAANWTQVGNFTTNLPATAVNSGYFITANLNDTGFTLPAGSSVGFYMTCTNTATTGFKLGYRSGATTGSPITNSDITVTHRARGTGLFATDATPVLRGYYGNVYYQKDTYGFWSRDNTTNVTGTTNAGDNFSGATPFPISGTLTSTSSTTETVTYTITSYDIDGVKSVQTATVDVLAAVMSTSQAIKNQVGIYPNPTIDFINVSGTDKIKSVQVFDLTGKTVNVSLVNNQVDVRNLPKGAYILKIKTSNGVSTEKFIKK